jgi:hypothetical protein
LKGGSGVSSLQVGGVRAAIQMSKQKVWRAAWPHVTVRILDETTGQPTVVAFNDGGILPPSADPEDVKRLAAKGALVEVEPDEPAKPAREPEPAKTGVFTGGAVQPEHATAKASIKEPEPAKSPAKPSTAKPGNGS